MFDDDATMKQTTIHDISDNVVKASAGAILPRVGLVEGLTCVVFITEATTQDVDDVTVEVQYTTDGGSNWRPVGRGTLISGASGVLPVTTKPVAIPLGFLDVVPENCGAEDFRWRTVTTIDATVADADDFEITAYLSPRSAFQGTID